MAEEWMSKLQCRSSIAFAAVVVALLSSRSADAQLVDPPGLTEKPRGVGNGFVTGVWYDVVNQAKAERRLENLQVKLRRDAERGDSVAVDRDVRMIDRDKYRIAVDEWLIRKNSLQDFCYYPIRTDAISYAAIAQAARPPQAPDPSRPVPTPGPMAAAPAITITIVNAEPAGAGIAFAIDGVAHQAVGGSRQDLAVAPNSTITYDGGGSLGQSRYLIAPGLYEFRSTAAGWALYKLPGTP